MNVPRRVVIEPPAVVRPEADIPDWVEELTSLDLVDTALGFGGFPLAAMMPDPYISIPLFLLGMFAQKVFRATPAGEHARKAVARAFRSLGEQRSRRALPGYVQDASRRLPARSTPASPVRRAPRVVVHMPGQTHNPSPRRHHGWQPAPRTTDGLVHTRPSVVRQASPQTWPPLQAGQTAQNIENALGEFDGLPVAVVGPTGSGKTSAMSRLAALRLAAGEVVMALAYHYDPDADAWPDGVHLVGAGYRRSEGDLAMYVALTEMVARYRLAARRALPALPRINVFVDEWKAVSENPRIVSLALRLINEGRKARVVAVITPHTATVEGMAVQGNGETRKGIGFVVMPSTPKSKRTLPRLADVWLGEPEKRGSRHIGQFVVRPPVNGQPAFGIPSGCWALARLGQAEVESVIEDAELPYPRGGAEAIREAILRWWAQERRKVVGLPPSRTAPVPHGTAPVRPGTAPVPAQNAGLPPSQTAPVPTFEQFARTFTPNSQAETRLILALLRGGYSPNKISGFLPSKTAPARERVQAVAARYNVDWKAHTRPAAGSAEERALVMRLHALGADIRRIAKLLDGNTAENQTRINGILYRGQG